MMELFAFTVVLTTVIASIEDPQLAAPLMNLGAVGVCLIALAWYHIRKDKAYEKRIDQMLAREKEFNEQLMAREEKYRGTLEKVSSTLDVMLALLRGGGGK